MLWRLDEGGEKMRILIAVLTPERENETLVGSKRQKNHNQTENSQLSKIHINNWVWFFKPGSYCPYSLFCVFILSEVMSIPKCPFSKKKTHLWRER